MPINVAIPITSSAAAPTIGRENLDVVGSPSLPPPTDVHCVVSKARREGDRLVSLTCYCSLQHGGRALVFPTRARQISTSTELLAFPT